MQLQDYVKEYFNPENTVVVGVGESDLPSYPMFCIYILICCM